MVPDLENEPVALDVCTCRLSITFIDFASYLTV